MHVDGIVRLHGIPQSIISDHNSRFLSRLWRKIQETLGTKFTYNTSYPQTDDQS